MASLPLPTVAAISLVTVPVSAKTRWMFVQVQDSDGRTGVGEATLQRQESAVQAVLEKLARAHLQRPADANARWAWRFAPKTLAGAAAASAIDHALWDLAAQRAGRPLAELLGTPTSHVHVYANINRGLASRAPEAFAAAARAAAGRGFAAVKIAPFDEIDVHGRWGAPQPATDTALDLGIERVVAVRDALGDGVELMVDCHWRFDEARAERAIDAVGAAVAPYWIECPVPEETAWLPAVRRLRSRASRFGMRLAGGEEGVGRESFEHLLDVYDVLMPDIKYVGGIAELRAVAERAAARNVGIAPHNPSGPVAHAASTHVCASLAAFDRLELQFNESALFDDIVSPAMPAPHEGWQPVPSTPGLGVTLGPACFAVAGTIRRDWT